MRSVTPRLTQFLTAVFVCALAVVLAPTLDAAELSSSTALDDDAVSKSHRIGERGRIKGASLTGLISVLDDLSMATESSASPFEPPGKPGDRPPVPPGHGGEPPGKPPDRPPDHSNKDKDKKDKDKERDDE